MGEVKEQVKVDFFKFDVFGEQGVGDRGLFLWWWMNGEIGEMGNKLVVAMVELGNKLMGVDVHIGNKVKIDMTCTPRYINSRENKC